MKAKPSIAIPAFLLLPAVLLGWTGISRAAGAPPLPVAMGERRSPMASGHLAVLLSDRSREKALLDYAKGVFLARLGFAAPVSPPAFLAKVQHACFVTFFSGKRVIACFGGFYPRQADLAGEIRENVTLALVRDPRARHIDREMALSADVQVTFPGEPESIDSYRQVNPVAEGLLVENDHAGVAVVPGEAKTASWAFRTALARLGERDPMRVRLSRFRAFAVSTRK